MGRLIGKARPRLLDVQCQRLEFQPGDRVIARVYHRLTRDEKRKIQKMVERWAGDHVEVLVIDSTMMEVYVDQVEGKRSSHGDRRRPAK